MEMGYTIDTAAAAVELQEAGLDQQAAMAIVGLVARSDSRLATKADLELFRVETNSRIDSLQKYMDTRFEVVERRFSAFQWVIGLIMALQLAMAARIFDLL